MRELEAHKIGEILGLLTHDLRNPLAALSSNVGYLTMIGEELGQEVQEAIFDLQLSLEVLTRISDAMEVVSQDLRDLPAPEASGVSTHALVQALKPQVERASLSHGVTLRVELAEEARIRVAEHAFSRALSNLLHNAITLSPSRSEVRLLLSLEEKGVCFRVEDEGPELAPELEEIAFSGSGQILVKGKLAGRYSRGLGLYVVGRSASLAGARLRIARRESGSAIELWAPFA